MATPTPIATATPVPSPSPTITPAGSVTIEVSQATNAHAYSILLQTNDMATFTQNGYSQTVPVSSTDASTFFTDLNANTPVSGVQTQPSCNKSSSFGTTTTLVYMASTSGDVSCPPSAQSPAQTLYTDANKIEGDVSPQVGGFHH